MHPNDIQVMRVWTRKPDTLCTDNTFPNNQDIEIVVDLESGTTILGSGAQVRVGTTVKDLTEWRTIDNCRVKTPVPTGFAEEAGTFDLTGSLGSSGWPEEIQQFVWVIPSAELTSPDRTNHVLSVHAFLITGVTNPNVSFVESAPFIVHMP